MIENKLKFMLENNKLDGLINNKSEAEKLCKLGTTEEVLDLLNKYDYNETKEIFERELLEILQEINLTEEELNKVTGGNISNRRRIARFLGVVSLAGSINMPTTMAGNEASVRAVKNQKDKNSGWMSHPKEDKLAKTLAGIVGTGCFITIGSLLLYGGKKLFGLSGNEIKHEEHDRNTDTSVLEGMPNDQLAKLAMLVAPNEAWDGSLANVNSIVVSLIQSPVADYTELVNDINSADLETYAKQGLQLWCKNTKQNYDENTRSITNANTWNENFGLLVKARWAVWLLLIKESKVTNEDLTNYVALRRFDKGAFLDDSWGIYAWYEYYDGRGTQTRLKDPIRGCYHLSPWKVVNAGSVTFAIWNLTDDLPEEDPTGRYTELKRDMEKIATDTLPNCMELIETD